MKLPAHCRQHAEPANVQSGFPHSLPNVFFIVLLTVVCGGCISCTESDSGGGSSSTVSNPGSAADGRLATVLETARSSHNVPALATVLVQDGEIIEIGAVGKRVVDGQENVTTADQWHLGSISKSITSTLAAVLIERGLLAWNTTIGEVLLDDIPDMRSEYRKVRVEQLMAHTGGLPVNIIPSPALSVGDIDDTSTLSMTERRLVWSADLLRMPPDAPLGTHLYSNSNYIVLGAVIEKVTSEPWEELIERELFAPLGMTDSGFGAPGLAGRRIQPWGHKKQGGSWQPVDPGSSDADNPLSMGPAGTVHSTLRDFSMYMAAHLAGERGSDGLLQASTFARLHSPQPGTDYAGGWGVDSKGWAGSPSFGHSGSTARWFATTVIAPERNAAVLVVTNSNSRDAVKDVIDVMIQRFEAMPK